MRGKQGEKDGQMADSLMTQNMYGGAKGGCSEVAQEHPLAERVSQAATSLRDQLGERRPTIGIILGSGLGSLADAVTNAVCVPYAQVPFMKQSTAPGHAGQFVCGELEGKTVLCMQDRLHGYEGNIACEVAFPVWVMHGLGLKTLIVTNAAGAINESYHVGDFCIMSDEINFTGQNPLIGPEVAALANPFPSMTDALDPLLRDLAVKVARDAGLGYQTGVYLGLMGPSLESPAEIRMFRSWGADTVGMSSVWEIIAARQMGMRVLGISLISNMAAGVGAKDGCGGASPSSDEVLAAAKRFEKDFAKLICNILAAM